MPDLCLRNENMEKNNRVSKRTFCLLFLSPVRLTAAAVRHPVVIPSRPRLDFAVLRTNLRVMSGVLTLA